MMSFDLMRDGGSMGDASIGLIYQRRGDDTLVLVARMAHLPQMSITAKQLDEEQRRVFAKTREYYATKGIKVLWECT